MSDEGVICILAGVPPSDPETAEKFYKWIIEKHNDDLRGFKGLKKTTNYRLVTEVPPLHPTEAKYPAFITIFEYESIKATQDYLTSPARLAGMKDGEGTWGTEVGAKKVWSVLYTPTKTLKTNSKKADGILWLLASVPPSDPETADKFYRWIDDKHVDDMLKFNGLIGATNYRQVTEVPPLHPTSAQYPAFLTIFEFESMQATQDYLSSPERLNSIKDAESTWGTQIATQKMWSVLYKPAKA